MNEWSFFLQNSWIQDGRIEDGYHHQVESEWMSEVFCANGENQSWQLWVSFRGKTRMSESKMAKFKMVEFKMAAIIKLSQNKWVKFIFVQNGLIPRWQNSRWLTSSSWVRLNEFESDWISLSQSFVLNGWIQDWQTWHDGCHHQINQIELVWVRVRVEWDCFSVNLREDNKVSESKMAVSESKMAEFHDGIAIFKLSQNECTEVFFVQNGWIQDGRIQDGCHHQVESEWMNGVFFCAKWWEPILASVSEFKR